jgi:hypothetical protein
MAAPRYQVVPRTPVPRYQVVPRTRYRGTSRNSRPPVPRYQVVPRTRYRGPGTEDPVPRYQSELEFRLPEINSTEESLELTLSVRITHIVSFQFINSHCLLTQIVCLGFEFRLPEINSTEESLELTLSVRITHIVSFQFINSHCLLTHIVCLGSHCLFGELTLSFWKVCVVLCRFLLCIAIALRFYAR